MRITGIRKRRQLGMYTNSAAGLFCACCVALTVSACGVSEGKHTETDAKPAPSKSAASSAPSSSASADPQAAVKKAVLETYDAFWSEQVKAYSKGSEKGTQLEKYATTDALARARTDLMNMKAAGNVTTGKPEHDAKVTALGEKKKVPDATITDCLDIRDWATVSHKTGKKQSLSQGNLTRYVTVVSAEKWDQRWMITKVEPKGRKC
jgi:hypothetical protein